MKVINHNTATRLFEDVESLAQQPHDSWGCVYFKLSDKQEDGRSNALYSSFVVKAITYLLAGSKGNIYLCEDGDIFILFQGALRPIVNKLSTHFGDVNPEQLRGLANYTLFSIFDFSRHWNGFYNLCEAKYLEALAAREQVRMQFTYDEPAVLPAARTALGTPSA